MLHTSRYNGNIVTQIASFLLLLIYVYLTYKPEPLFVFSVGCAVCLFFVGFSVNITAALLTSSIAVLIYGATILYQAFLLKPALEITWNDLTWLIIIPYFALMGGINRDRSAQQEDTTFSFINMELATAPLNQTPCTVDEELKFLSGTAFLYKLEEEVLVALRERSQFRILLIEIDRFKEFKQLVGYDQAQQLLNKVAGWFADIDSAAMSQVGEAVLAGIFIDSDADALNILQLELDSKLQETVLMRPRRESIVQLQLKYGIAECPSDGIEAKILMEKAKNGLSWSNL